MTVRQLAYLVETQDQLRESFCASDIYLRSSTPFRFGEHSFWTWLFFVEPAHAPMNNLMRLMEWMVVECGDPAEFVFRSSHL